VTLQTEQRVHHPIRWGGSFKPMRDPDIAPLAVASERLDAARDDHLLVTKQYVALLNVF
jgi:hypothetical protein